MTRKHPRGPAAAHDGIDPDFFFSDSKRKQHRRKDFQLCGQVQQAISDVLSELDDPLLVEVWVARVEPAPDASHLLVWLDVSRLASEGAPAHTGDILARVERIAPRLRAEVAAAIHRKRVPGLSYALAPAEGQP